MVVFRKHRETVQRGNSRRNIQKHVDFDLIEDFIICLITFSGYIFLALNFATYMILDTWPFGDYFGKASIAILLVWAVLRPIKWFYEEIKRKCRE